MFYLIIWTKYPDTSLITCQSVPAKKKRKKKSTINSHIQRIDFIIRLHGGHTFKIREKKKSKTKIYRDISVHQDKFALIALILF